MSKRELLRRMGKSAFFMVGITICLIIVLLAIFAPYITPFSPTKVNLVDKFIAPEFFSKGTQGHVFGTDAVGQDILARLLYGARISLVIAVCAVLCSCVIGTVLGLIGGYFGGKVDLIVVSLSDIQLSLPTMMLAIAVMAVLGASAVNLLIVMSLTGWVAYARMARSTVMSIRESDFIRASQVLGASKRRILFRELLPNCVTPIIIQASQQVGFVIMMEAGLSFLGCGVPATTPTWGTMISDGRAYITYAPWTVLVPGVALMITVLAFRFLGDGLRDSLYPKKKR